MRTLALSIRFAPSTLAPSISLSHTSLSRFGGCSLRLARGHGQARWLTSASGMSAGALARWSSSSTMGRVSQSTCAVSMGGLGAGGVPQKDPTVRTVFYAEQRDVDVGEAINAKVAMGVWVGAVNCECGRYRAFCSTGLAAHAPPPKHAFAPNPTGGGCGPYMPMRGWPRRRRAQWFRGCRP